MVVGLEQSWKLSSTTDGGVGGAATGLAPRLAAVGGLDADHLLACVLEAATKLAEEARLMLLGVLGLGGASQ